LKRARQRIGVRPTKEGRPGDRGQRWIWTLSPDVGQVGPLRENTPHEEGQPPSKSLYFSEEGQDSHMAPFAPPKRANPSPDLAPFGAPAEPPPSPREPGEDDEAPAARPCYACGGVIFDADGVCLRCRPPVT
jgi:hypothetical protein